MPRRLLALALVASLAFAAGCSGCAEQGATSTPFPLPPSYEYTPGGVAVYLPAWVDSTYPNARAEAIAQIDGAGVPPGWVVEVTVPIFPWVDGKTLTTGMTIMDERRIIAGWRHMIEQVPLPCLDHEVGHAQHPDNPCWGHLGDPDCEGQDIGEYIPISRNR